MDRFFPEHSFELCCSSYTTLSLTCDCLPHHITAAGFFLTIICMLRYKIKKNAMLAAADLRCELPKTWAQMEPSSGVELETGQSRRRRRRSRVLFWDGLTIHDKKTLQDLIHQNLMNHGTIHGVSWGHAGFIYITNKSLGGVEKGGCVWLA